MTSEKLLREAEEIRDRVLSERRTLHQSPGTGFDIGETLAFVRKELADMGLQPVDCGRAGLVALVGGKKQGKVFLPVSYTPLTLPTLYTVYIYVVGGSSNKKLHPSETHPEV